tara:strand:+ start:96 stop:698 length:603 start_codon:yes stop_codon:yes gene_type:complete
MCEPTTTTMMYMSLATSIASAGIQYQQQKAQQKNAYNAQIRQNEIAKKNALQRYASEQLRIRQVAKQSSDKGFQASIKSKKVRGEFTTVAGSRGLAMSGSTNALMADYYRTEGNYNSSLQNNMNINLSQYQRNMEAIQFGQESQSTYVNPPNPELLFATQALNVANSYYSLEAEKEMRGLQTNSQKSKNQKSYNKETYNI